MPKGGGGKGKCMGCGEAFSGERSFNMHRTGSYGDPIYTKGQVTGFTPHNRHCLTIAEMQAKGMTKNDRGVWTTGEKMSQDALAKRRGIDESESEEETE